MDRKNGHYSEKAIWKTVAVLISLGLLLCVTLNLQAPETVPAQLTSFLFGCLVCIGVGHTVAAPRSSTTSLSATAEKRFRRGQYIAGMVLSILLALAFLLTGLRAAPSSWMLVPVMFLAPVLLLRELVIGRLHGRDSTATPKLNRMEKNQDEDT